MGVPKPFPTRWPEPDIIPERIWENPDIDEDSNYEMYPEEDPHILPEEKLVPYAVTWGVTHPCNLKCYHCYDVVGYKRQDLSTSQAMEVINRLKQIGITFIVFSGGEPLLRGDLFDLMARCQRESISIAMRSNATLITPEKADHLQRLNLSVAGVSLDGADSTTHDSVRGKGTFRKTIRGIELLLERGVRVNVEVVLSHLNFHQALAFVGLAERLGVQEINFSAITSQGRAQNLTASHYLNYADWHEVTSTLYQASTGSKVTVSPSCPLIGACVACIEPNITCDGWVTPCYLSKRKLFHILEVPTNELVDRLRQQRLLNQNVCGRPSWAGQGFRQTL